MSDDPIDITKAREKKAQKKARDGKESARKPSIIDTFNLITDILNHSPLTPPDIREFPISLLFMAPEKGSKVILLEGEHGVVEPVKTEYVAEELTKYLRTATQVQQLGPRQVDLCLIHWRRATSETIKPADVLWANEPGYTYCRLPWKKGPGPTPEWDKLIERMGTNRAAFMAFVGSIFTSNSDCQQYLFLYGEGGNGKGAITRFIGRALGQAFGGMRIPTKQERFWTFGLIGKRVVNFAEADVKDFLQSDLLKSMVGGDAIPVEEKRGSSYSINCKLKIIFSSNDRPQLSSKHSDIRRSLFIELPPIEGKPDPTYEDRLWEEGGAFLTNCLEVYRTLCPNFGQIPVNTEELELHISTLEEEYEVYADERLDFHPIDTSAIARDRGYVTARDMDDIIRYRFNTQNERTKFRSYLERKHGVKKSVIKLDNGKTIKAYPGCSKKFCPEHL